MKYIIGRKKEIEELERLYNAEDVEFVAVYGRRRVGKTYLIKEVFKDRKQPLLTSFHQDWLLQRKGFRQKRYLKNCPAKIV